MPIYDLYSRRKNRAEGGEPDVYQYEDAPHHLRMQICYILNTAFGPYHPGSWSGHNTDGWVFVHEALCREKDLPYLWTERGSPYEDCFGAIQRWESIDDWLDVVELFFRAIVHLRNDGSKGITQDADDAINEVNFRFREAGLGYQFEAGQIVRVDSYLVHAEVVKPALVLLGDSRFKGAEEEFLSAHAHYRAGEHEDAILDANRAFESTMKTICDIMGWKHQMGARASDLIKIIRTNGLLPDYLDSSFDQLIATLKSDLPQVRNEAGGHGQGVAPRVTPGYVAGYALHLAAANAVLLVEALKATE